jgi:hypothetical protein
MNARRALESWQYWGHPGRHTIQTTALGVYLEGAVYKPNVPVGRLYPTRLDSSETRICRNRDIRSWAKIYGKFANKESCICTCLPDKLWIVQTREIR